MNNRKFSATVGTRLAILMLALLAALAAGQALSAQPTEAMTLLRYPGGSVVRGQA
jgi:hypothetical protein